MFIRSERLFLRPTWPEDCEELIALITEESVLRDAAAMQWPYTVDDARCFIARPRDRLLPHFAITLPTADGARPIGSIGLGKIGDDVQVGFWIAHRHWRQGYATEATRAVMGLARAIGHDRLVATHLADNVATTRVLEKAGFIKTGQTRLHDVPAITFAVDLGELCNGDGPVMHAA